MNDTELRELLENSPTIAVVGMSTNAEKAAHAIPGILLEAGYTVIPVHPTATEILGQRVYRTLAEVPVPVDIVDVFRPSGEAPAVAKQAVEIGAKTLWLQLGIRSTEAAHIAQSAGLTYIEDLCIGERVRHFGVHPKSES